MHAVAADRSRSLSFSSASSLLLLILLSLCILLTGCPGPLVVRQAMPAPNVDLPHHDERLALEFESTLAADYEVGEQNGVRRTFVHEWRQTLVNGFRKAFERSFALGNEDAELVVQIVEARLEFGRTAMGLTAIIRFRARLVDAASGKILARASGEALSKRGGNTKDATYLAGSAVETMYEQIAKAFFAVREE
jgi:hypothetical protein